MNDRAVKFKEEFHLDPELTIEQLMIEMEHMQDVSTLEKSIQDLSLTQKLEETEAFKEKMKTLQIDNHVHNLPV